MGNEKEKSNCLPLEEQHNTLLLKINFYGVFILIQ